MSAENIRLLKLMVKGSYDLQGLRIQAGLRLCANFRAKLKAESKIPEEEMSEDELAAAEDLSPEALDVIKQLKDSYRRLTDGIARNRTIPAEKGFHGDELIAIYTELVLVDQYIRLEQQETAQFRQLIGTLEKIPIYIEYLADIRGVGPALAAVLITYLDPVKARHASSFWRYCGLDVGLDGAGRSRRAEHLIERSYIDKTGKQATRLSTTYNPWLKMKLLGALGPSFLRSNSPWRACFDNYKNRIMSDPAKQKVTLVEWKKQFNEMKKKVNGKEMEEADMAVAMRLLWSPGRIKNAAIRYMVKQFLADFWLKWRALEGLPISEPYAVAKLHMQPHGADGPPTVTTPPAVQAAAE
jgi:hypothetical protein